MEDKILTREGIEMTQEELWQEYSTLANETQVMVSFEGYIELRKKYRYE